MNAMRPGNTFDAQVYGDRLRQEIGQLIDDFLEAGETVEDPRFKALCETGAEVLVGLRRTLGNYAEQQDLAVKEFGPSAERGGARGLATKAPRGSPEPLAREVAAATDY